MHPEQQQTWTHCEVKFFPFVEPDLSDTRCVLQHDVGNATGERVRTLVSENVANVRTRSDLENTAALPNLLANRDFIFNKLCKNFHALISLKKWEKLNQIYLHGNSFLDFRHLKSITKRIKWVNWIVEKARIKWAYPKCPCLRRMSRSRRNNLCR